MLELAITAGILGAVKSVEDSRIQAQNARREEMLMNRNARIEQREANREEAETLEAARRQRAENARLQSAQRAAYGKSGAALSSGSPLAVLGDTAANQELAVQDTHRSGALAYNRHMTQAENYKYQGRLARASYRRSSGNYALAGSLIQTGSDIANIASQGLSLGTKALKG